MFTFSKALPNRAFAMSLLLAMTIALRTMPAIAADPQDVMIDNFTFTPATLTVMVGTTVTWTNGDDIPHTVRETKAAFKSPPLDTGDRYSFTFTTPGEFDYFCSLHPHMTAKILVRPDGG